ncbi:MAG: tripartite tricarboxylate transporter substrate binding protein [Acetobacteraceae bacterium]|nr:tripartite tricarboxylate transporter substrate binding protein [Acetobacteraceae bacterium]
MINNISRRVVLGGVAGLAAGATMLRSARAATYPDRPVRIIVPFAPGGPTDVVARVVAAQLGAHLNGSFVVENHPGAGGNIGCGVVAHAEPDGYTLLIHSSALVVNPGLYKKVPYDIYKDFAPLAELGTSPNIFFANPKSGFKAMADVVAKAKAEPNALSYASAGIGTTPHLSAELFKLRADVQITHVPYNGGGPGMQAVLQNTTPFGCVALTPTLPLIAAGQLVPLAVTSRTRWPDLPNVPTMIESGYPDFVTDTFQAFMAPAKTPQPVIDALVKAAIALLHEPDTEALLRKDGLQVLANGPAGMKKRIDDEVPMWRDLVAKSGIEPV